MEKQKNFLYSLVKEIMKLLFISNLLESLTHLKIK